MKLLQLLHRPAVLLPTALIAACLLAAGIAVTACGYLAYATQPITALPVQ
ncbi:hypothetical protein [Leucobacter tenebrionis]|nr:hypothetical protein [Leucobacter tenebrionis]QZY52557.1 hypothetical protein KVY00_03600 [Leucobacter tenebrionis]